jgi:hypothetical protein
VVEELLSQVVCKVGRYQIIKDYHEGHKECMQESLRILEFVERIKLRRDRDLKIP